MPVENEVFYVIMLVAFVGFGLALAYGSFVAPGKKFDD